MSDYSWIKPGVKAVICYAPNYPILLGEVVTIKSNPELMWFCNHPRALAVHIEEGYELGKLCGGGEINPTLDRLKPHRDDSQQLTTWESIAKDIGVDIRRIREAV